MENLWFCYGGQSELWQNFKSDQETSLMQNEFETDAFKAVELPFRSPNKASVVSRQGIGEGINCR